MSVLRKWLCANLLTGQLFSLIKDTDLIGKVAGFIIDPRFDLKNIFVFSKRHF